MKNKQSKFKKDVPTTYQWLINRNKLPKGSSYIEQNISIRQCAQYMNEYIKEYYEQTK